MEPAPRRRRYRVRRIAFENRLLDRVTPAPENRRGEKSLRIGVPGVFKEALAVANLHELARVHHQDAIRHELGDAEVVGDEQVRHPHVALKLLEQVENMGLRGEIERRDRLIQHDELGVDGDRAGDPDPLALAPAQLVRKPAGVHCAQAHPLEELRHPLPPAVVEPVDPQRVCDGIADRHPRIEGAERVLEHHLHEQAGPAQLFAAEAGDVDAVECNGAGRGFEETNDETSQGGLPASRFTDHRHHLAGFHREAHVVHRLDRPVRRPDEGVSPRLIVLPEALDAEQATVRHRLPPRTGRH